VIKFKCVRCKNSKSADNEYVCSCGGLFEVDHTFREISFDLFDSKLIEIGSPWSSGVWRYKELIHPELSDKCIISRPEGNTNLYKRIKVADYSGIKELFLKYMLELMSDLQHLIKL